MRSWSFAGSFKAPQKQAPRWPPPGTWPAPLDRVGWDPARAWEPSLSKVVDAASRDLRAVLAEWDERLRDLGGDPSRQDWQSFRPLRLSREEDWSDWLAHLLCSERSGRFATRLLGRDASESERYRVTHVEREKVALGYRADLVVHFADGEATQIEVKVGDLSLEKTVATGDALRKIDPATRYRNDYLLLPAHHVSAWDRVKRDDNGDEKAEKANRIEVLTWHDVARALRQSLLDEGEWPTWRAWAFAFIGAVEQGLLNFEQVEAHSNRRRWNPEDVARVEFLKEALT